MGTRRAPREDVRGGRWHTLVMGDKSSVMRITINGSIHTNAHITGVCGVQDLATLGVIPPLQHGSPTHVRVHCNRNYLVPPLQHGSPTHVRAHCNRNYRSFIDTKGYQARCTYARNVHGTCLVRGCVQEDGTGRRQQSRMVLWWTIPYESEITMNP